MIKRLWMLMPVLAIAWLLGQTSVAQEETGDDDDSAEETGDDDDSAEEMGDDDDSAGAVEEVVGVPDHEEPEEPEEPETTGGWVPEPGGIVLEGYEQAAKRGKKGAASRLDVIFTFRNTTDKPLFGFTADILWAGYHGVTLLKKPYQHAQEIAAGETFVVDGSYPETSSASSVYKILAPMSRRDFEVSIDAVQVMYELPTVVEPAEPLHPPFKEVVTGEVLDGKLARNGRVVKCFVDALQNGMQLSGTVHVGFTVHGDGTVTDGHIVEEQHQGTVLEMCLSQQLNDLTFGQFHGDPHDLKYPFTIQ